MKKVSEKSNVINITLKAIKAGLECLLTSFSRSWGIVMLLGHGEFNNSSASLSKPAFMLSEIEYEGNLYRVLGVASATLDS